MSLDGVMPRDVIEWRLLVDEPEVLLDVRRNALEHQITVSKTAGAPLGAEVDSAIFDEVHELKNPKGKKNKAAHEVLDRSGCTGRFGLSGTPMSNKYEELWVLFNFASDGHVGSKKDFKSRYANSLGQGLKKNAKQWELMKRFRTQQGTPRAISSTRHPCPSVRLLPHADAAHPIHFACERRDQGADAELDAPTLQGHHRRPDAHEARQCRPLPTRG